ncbi:hypothetical protein [Actinocatenispora rupis]|nr:hypothetical protein [Actinocatenispora rupis]
MSAPGRRTALFTAAALAAVTLTGCAAGTTYHLRGRAELVNALAARLDHHDATSYTATYRLGDGSTATVTVNGEPKRIAYTFTTGRYVRTGTTIVRCTPTVCTLDDRPTTQAKTVPDVDAIDAASAHRFIPAEQVLTLLMRAAEDPSTRLARSTGALAGQSVTCVDVPGSFRSCITGTGALASFTGTVGGHRVDASLVDYQPEALGHPFGPSRTARIDDRRTAPTAD